MRPITIDFEASCLPRDGLSFPIEVGIADCRGNQRSWLIRPHANWKGWTWTLEAERTHGISRETIERDGIPVESVLNELNVVIGECKVVADSWLDAEWLETLCIAAREKPRFSILHLSSVLDDLAPTAEQLALADARVASETFHRHRAGDDARHLAIWLTALQESVRVGRPYRSAIAA